MNTVLYISFKVNVKPHVVHPDRQDHFKIYFFSFRKFLFSSLLEFTAFFARF